MLWVEIGGVHRTTLVSKTVYRCDRPEGFRTGSGDSPASTLIPYGLDKSAGLRVTCEVVDSDAGQGGTGAEGSDEITEVRCIGKTATTSERDTGLDDHEIIGHPAALRELGTLGGVAYTWASPKTWVTGYVAPGSYIRPSGWLIRIQRTRPELSAPSSPRYEGWGPALAWPSGHTGSGVWEVWDFATDGAISIRAFVPVESWESGGTRTLASNGDIKIQMVDRQFRVSVAFSGGTETITAPAATRPEKFFMVRWEYTDSTKLLELFVDGVSAGTATGTGTRTKSGNTWRTGSNQAGSGEYWIGQLMDFRWFTTLQTDATQQESGPLDPSTSGLYAYHPGEADIPGLTIDNAAAVNKGGGKVGIPVTGHGLATGVAVSFPGASDYPGRYTVDATSSTNEIVITATFVSVTFAGTEVVDAVEKAFDIATANAASPKDITITGAYRGTGLGGSVVTPGATAQGATESDSGLAQEWPLGQTEHVAGVLVDGENGIYSFGDMLRGIQDFEDVQEEGVSMTITDRVTSLLALLALNIPAATEAQVYPQMGLARVTRTTDVGGVIGANVIGAGPWVRSWESDGVSDYIEFTTAANSLLAASHTVRLVGSFLNTTGAAHGLVLHNSYATGTGATLLLSPGASGDQYQVSYTIGGAGGTVGVTAFPFARRDEDVSVEVVASAEVGGGSATVTLTVNGELIGTDTGSYTTAAASGALRLQRDQLGVELKGKVSELAILDANKSAAWARETLHADVSGDGDLQHHYPGTSWKFPASTLEDEAGSMDGTITSTGSWVGGIAPLVPRSLTVYVAREAGYTGSMIDISGTSAWPDDPLTHHNGGQEQALQQVLDDLLVSWHGARYVTPAGVLTFGQIVDPSTLAAADTWDIDKPQWWQDGAEAQVPQRIVYRFAHVAHPEDGSGLAGGTNKHDRARWSQEYRRVEYPVANATTLHPLTGPPAGGPSWWKTHRGAYQQAKREEALLGTRRQEGTVTRGSALYQSEVSLLDRLDLTGKLDLPNDPAVGQVIRLLFDLRSGELLVSLRGIAVR